MAQAVRRMKYLCFLLYNSYLLDYLFRQLLHLDTQPFFLSKNSGHMTKLIIQIPCYNEAETLPAVIKTLPRTLDGIDVVEWLIIDDGCRDGTADVARKLGVDHIVTHTRNRGLARAFYSGILACLKLNADIIVNTDADNQYDQSYINELIRPILELRADVVIGSRPISSIEHFSFHKKILQKLGSWVVRKISNTNVQDAPSGFRAFSRDAAARLNVFTGYTYTLETIVQAGLSGFEVLSVPIGVNPQLRPSRLVKNIPSYVFKSFVTMIRSAMYYAPFHFFMFPAFFSLSIGFVLGFRFVYYYSIGQGNGHIQSLILCSFLMMLGILFLVIGFLADLIGANRMMIKNIELILLSDKKGQKVSLERL